MKETIRTRFIKVMRKVIYEDKRVNSQKAFAKKMRRSDAIVSHWVKGRIEPTKEDIERICLAFNVSADYIVCGRGGMEYGQDSNTRIDSLEKRVKILEKIEGI